MTKFWLVAVFVLIAFPANSKWKPQYAELPQAERDWYSTRILTPAAEAIYHFHSCCNNADRVLTKFKVNRVNGQDEWWWLDGEVWKLVPPIIIWWDEHSPTGEPVMFAVNGRPVCFYPPQSGI